MNLLPLTEQIKVKTEYRVRLLALSLFGGAIVCVIGAVFLLPAYVAVFAKEKSISVEFSALKESDTPESAALAGELQELKKQIASLSLAEGNGRVMDTISLAIKKESEASALSAPISITNIVYDTDKAGGRTLSLGGVAGNRNALRALVKALGEEYPFEFVRVPVSNFVKEKDIPFTVSITIRNQKKDVRDPLAP